MAKYASSHNLKYLTMCHFLSLQHCNGSLSLVHGSWVILIAALVDTFLKCLRPLAAGILSEESAAAFLNLQATD